LSSNYFVLFTLTELPSIGFNLNYKKSAVPLEIERKEQSDQMIRKKYAKFFKE
jgi:hypothetical protein